MKIYNNKGQLTDLKNILLIIAGILVLLIIIYGMARYMNNLPIV